MKQGNEPITSPTSMVSFVLTAAGLLLTVLGIGLAAVSRFDPLPGLGLSTVGLVLIGLGSLRRGQLDLIYEQRLTRAVLAEAAASNHAAKSEGEAM